MFDVKVDAVNVLNQRGKTRASARSWAAAPASRKPTCGWWRARRSISSAAMSKESESMALIKIKPTSPGTRFAGEDRSLAPAQGRAHIALLDAQEQRTGARNTSGRQTTRHIGGGHKQRYRIVDFKRDKDGDSGVVERLEYDPNRTAHLALVLYKDGERRYIIAPKGVQAGDEMPLRRRMRRSSRATPCRCGTSRWARTVHCIELKARQGRAARAQCRAARHSSRRARASMPRSALQVGRDPQGARRLPRHHRRGRQRRAQPAQLRQGRRGALARRAPDGARRRR